jgi:hypothetical protein
MLPGLKGHLVAPSFLEQRLATAGPPDDRARRRLADLRRRARSLGPATSLRALLDAAAAPLLDALALGSPSGVEYIDSAGLCTIRTGSQPALLLVAAWGEPLHTFWRTAVSGAIRRGAGWCLLFNGRSLRLVDPRRPYSRRYAEFDLDLVADDDRTFAAFWFVMRRLATSLDDVIEASDRHTVAVCRSLRTGVLSAAAEMLAALLRAPDRRRGPPPGGAFEQALTIVYRMLFLLFAEARGLVPLWHPIYRASYSIAAARAVAERPGGPAGLWDALQAIARLAHAGCRAGDLRVTPFNGRLFAPIEAPLAERRDLDDEAARRAVLALATRPSADGAGRQPIEYADLGVDQLGAVYETILDYEPRLRPDRTVSLQPGSGVRKTTGTYYTPRPIADYLVRRTLAPLVHDRASEDILKLRILDPAMGSGAFLVAACRYLAGAYEAAIVREGGCHPSDIGDAERAAFRRTIAERCLYGVDVNPTAVQLARLSLWLATLAADRPLTFLDHRLRTGDSLLGAWLIDLRRPPPIGRRARRILPDARELFSQSDVQDAIRTALPVRFSLESIPDDTLEDVRSKERALAALNRRETALSKWKRIADLWCATWFCETPESLPASAFPALADVVLTGRGPLPAAAAERFLRSGEDVARARRFFHWELEFPEAFFDPSGGRLSRPGFDALVGNPPWDVIRADAGPPEARRRSRSDAGCLMRYAREAGIYSARSQGHRNRYQLFLERAMSLTRPGGRIGLVLPSGLATDQGSAGLRRRLLAECDVDSLVGFDNALGVFPIHRGVRFLLATATAGSPTRSIACRFGERLPESLEAPAEEPSGSSSWFPVRLTPALVERLSGPDLVIPDFRTSLDVAIAERAAVLFPPLGSPEGWSARFGRELNASDDRHAFCRPDQGWPIVEGKHLEPFRVRRESARHGIRRDQAQALLGPAWRDRWRLAYRDVAASTNRLTLIAAILPPGCASTHTIFCLRTPLPLASQHFLCGVFNSFVVNYLVRMRMTTHVTTAAAERLPIPRPDDSPRLFHLVAALARRLSRRHDPEAHARLQASVARLYQLSPAELGHVLDTFPLVAESEREAVYRAFGGG